MLEAGSLSSFETTFGVILTAVGCVFAFVGLVLARASGRIAGGERAEGRVVGFDVSEPTLGAEMIHRPKVSFITNDGRPITATGRYAANPRRQKIGDVVTVFYDPQDPDRVQVRAARALGSCMEAAFVLFGIALAAIGIAMMSSS